MTARAEQPGYDSQNKVAPKKQPLWRPGYGNQATETRTEQPEQDNQNGQSYHPSILPPIPTSTVFFLSLSLYPSLYPPIYPTIYHVLTVYCENKFNQN
jgi:hypothetical protein